jgi:iron complex transport system substrate-binding protein
MSHGSTAQRRRISRPLTALAAALVCGALAAGCSATGSTGNSASASTTAAAQQSSSEAGSSPAGSSAAGSSTAGSAGSSASDSAESSAPGSSGSAPAGGPVTVGTADGDLTLQQPATKIAVMQWQFLDMLLSMGVHPTVIADEQVAGSGNPIPPQFEGKLGDYTSIGSRLSPSLEVLASQPLDLILVDKGEHLKDKDQFSTFAPTGVFDTWGWDAFYPNLEALGQLTGHSQQAADVEQQIKAHLSDAKGKLTSVNGKTALVGVATNDKFFPFTGNSLEAGVLKDLGFGYGYKEVPGALTEQVPLESLAAAKPDVLFLAADPGAAMVTDTWKGNALWESIPAVKNGMVFRVDRGVWSTGRGPMAIDLMIDEVLKLLNA